MTFHNVSDLFELASLCVAVILEYTAKTQTLCISRHRFDQNIPACFSGNRAAVHYYKYASKWAGVSESAIIYIVVFFLHLFFVFHLEGNIWNEPPSSVMTWHARCTSDKGPMPSVFTWHLMAFVSARRLIVEPESTADFLFPSRRPKQWALVRRIDAGHRKERNHLAVTGYKRRCWCQCHCLSL